MDAATIITIIIFSIGNIGAFINFWVKFNIKIKELDLKIQQISKDMGNMIIKHNEDKILLDHRINKVEDEHERCIDKLENKFNQVEVKLDTLLKIFNEFRIYYEKDKLNK